ncbi:flavin reductase family protein [Auraticoccus monumenti]|uniref:NADH-FMN oxidoreductase RutF, flavin reductase (DIM6/NTAB) family n=1 Tax=Auraticoccus monumenti TaxID=675864 RepID=A0A1G6VGE8_9ACTN|nr:flavin reductase family protein [Auraticoccus monumenti]SDD51906.1 NADH-FMN oxidoreductase RutF, flavin reductase (DIM6/NTAB) family [Auraticoccus monumenti]
MHFYEPRLGHRLPHDPFNALVAPRPIGWVSSVAADGTLNLAPYSFFNAFCYTPPLIGFASTSRKHSARNAEACGEFVWNLVTRPLLQAMNQTSTSQDVDEFASAGLTPAPSRVVSVPRVAEARVAMECRLSQVLELTGADGSPTGAVMVFGEVVGVHIDEELLGDGVYDTAAADPVLRGGGPSAYFTLGERLDLRRPD